MRAKSINNQLADQVDQGVENAARRASGRVRKPTAKAVALNGSKSYSPSIEDTIVIGGTPPKRRRSLSKEPTPISTTPKDEPKDVHMPPEIPETPVVPKVDSTQTPTPPEVTQDALEPVVETTLLRRQSLRDRKLTPKALSESKAAQKRPAPDDSDDDPLRKSARVSYSGAKVPSKLRYSVSSSQRGAEEADAPDTVEIADTAAAKKSKIIVLKYKKQFALSNPPTQFKAKDRSALPNKTSKGTPKRPKATTHDTVTEPEPRPQPVDLPRSCNLTCLSPSSRLLAFAQIALQMPDDDEDGAVVAPGSVHDWRMYTHTWCQCDQGHQWKTQRTNSAELARALMPNTVAQGTKHDPVGLSKSNTSEKDLLLTPVNTILRASDAERLSQLYTGPGNQGADPLLNGLPSTSTQRTTEHHSASFNGLPPHGHVPNSNSESYVRRSPLVPSPSNTTRRTYEDRLRDEYNALADIRKRAVARGIPWTYNQTFNDIHALIMEAEEREHQTQYRQQVISPPTVLGRAHEASASDARPSPTGFGVLLPPRGSTFVQRNTNGPQEPTNSPTVPTTNGANGPNSEPPKPGQISFVEESNPANPSRRRRPSSPNRPKSSRFRVDPSGLQGRRPGPGTIINMEEMRKKAAGIKRLGEALRMMQAVRERSQKRRMEELAAEKRARKEAAATNGNGEA